MKALRFSNSGSAMIEVWEEIALLLALVPMGKLLGKLLEDAEMGSSSHG